MSGSTPKAETLLVFDDKASLKHEVYEINEEIDYAVKFCAFLFDHILQSQSSFVISPLSILIDLATLLCGTTDKIRDEVCKKIFANGSMTERQLHLLGQVKHHLLRDKEKFLKMFSFLVVEASYPVANEYANAVRIYFDTRVRQGRFTSTTLRYVDELVQEETNGMLDFNTHLVKFDEKVKMLLVDCTHFVANFKHRFQVTNYVTEFYNANGSKTSAYFLHSTGTFRMGHNANYGCEVFEIPYERDGLCFNILLPENGKLLECFNRENPNTLTEAISSLLGQTKMAQKQVDVYIPKFELKTKISLRYFLESYGVTPLFNAQEADFSRMIKKDSSSKGLALHDIVQTSLIGVGENTSPMEAISPVEDGDTFVCNHPFAFALTALVEGSIIVLYLGVVQSLRQE